MALFTRRVLQRLIFENADFATVSQRQRHADAINRAGPDSLATEWEIAVLNTLSKLALVEHEPQYGNRYPDVRALSKDGGEELFVADIATVYEAGRETQNPISALSDLLIAGAMRAGLQANRLRLQVEGALEGPARNQVMRLKLPPPNGLREFFDREVQPFLDQRVREPESRAELTIRSEETQIAVTYDPANRFFGTAYPSFTASYSSTRNPVYNTLKRKLKQLRDASAQATIGVILCAADTDLTDSNSAGVGTRGIINNVFRQNTALSFVLTLWATDSWSSSPGSIYGHLYTNPIAARPLTPQGRAVLQSLTRTMPSPANGGVNAINEILFHRWQKGRYFYGSWSMSETQIKISARSLMELLAGRMSLEQFLEHHGGNRGFVTLFEQKLRGGQLLVGANVETVPERDDDWVVFQFGPPDPALAPLRASRQDGAT